jgi:hypothetical protein
MYDTTLLQKKIIDYMKNMTSYKTWGFSAIGYREYARINKLNTIAVSNAMRSLLKNGIFNDSRCKDRYSDTIYFLKK